MMDGESSIVVTVDGPAASGKTSVSRLVAAAMGWNWVSTGAFYRGLAYVAQREGVNLDSPEELVKCAKSNRWSVEMARDKTEVWYRSIKVTDYVMLEENGHLASKVSHFPEVREALLGLQRQCAKPGEGLVAEGRDCGTVVFPWAQLKIYLTAPSCRRASRRALEQGSDVKETLKLQRERDARDSSRAAAPLQVPENAIVIDTSQMDLEEVVAKVLESISVGIGLTPAKT
jgi:cytidylate kinase